MKALSAYPAASEGIIIITSAWTAREIAPAVNPNYIISLVEPGTHLSIPTGAALRQHLRLDMHDIDNQGAPVPPPYIGPTAEHVQQIIDVARNWDRSGRLDRRLSSSHPIGHANCTMR